MEQISILPQAFLANMHIVWRENCTKNLTCSNVNVEAIFTVLHQFVSLKNSTEHCTCKFFVHIDLLCKEMRRRIQVFRVSGRRDRAPKRKAQDPTYGVVYSP